MRTATPRRRRVSRRRRHVRCSRGRTWIARVCHDGTAIHPRHVVFSRTSEALVTFPRDRYPPFPCRVQVYYTHLCAADWTCIGRLCPIPRPSVGLSEKRSTSPADRRRTSPKEVPVLSFRIQHCTYRLLDHTFPYFPCDRGISGMYPHVDLV